MQIWFHLLCHSKKKSFAFSPIQEKSLTLLEEMFFQDCLYLIKPWTLCNCTSLNIQQKFLPLSSNSLKFNLVLLTFYYVLMNMQRFYGAINFITISMLCNVYMKNLKHLEKNSICLDKCFTTCQIPALNIQREKRNLSQFLRRKKFEELRNKEKGKKSLLLKSP